MRIPRLSKVLLAALAGLGLSLQAQAPLVFDFHLGTLSAQGDFRSEIGSSRGIDTGLSLVTPLSPRLSLRPRLTYQQFKVLENDFTYSSTRYSDRGFESAKWSAWSFGADLLLRPAGPEGRLYLLSGLSYKAWKVRSYGTFTTQDRLNTTRTFTVDDSATSNEPALDMGLGFQLFRHLSLESRMTLASYRRLSYNTLQMGIVAHF